MGRASKLLCIWVSVRAQSPGDFFGFEVCSSIVAKACFPTYTQDNWLFFQSSVHTTEAAKILISLLINTLQSYVILERAIGWQKLGLTGSWVLRGIGGEQACRKEEFVTSLRDQHEGKQRNGCSGAWSVWKSWPTWCFGSWIFLI